MRYWVNEKYLALVAGPFGNLSDEFLAVAYLHARERTKKEVDTTRSS
jgi:hypothetical protein